VCGSVITVCCSMLQRVAVRCSELVCSWIRHSVYVLVIAPAAGAVLPCVCVAVCCSVLQCVAVCCSHLV